MGGVDKGSEQPAGYMPRPKRPQPEKNLPGRGNHNPPITSNNKVIRCGERREYANADRRVKNFRPTQLLERSNGLRTGV
jgi:hypothetical protein